MKKYPIIAISLVSCLTFIGCFPTPRPNPLANAPTYPIKPSVLYDTVQSYCLDCHNADKMKGNLDLTRIVEGNLNDHPRIWQDVFHSLKHKDMPPMDEGVKLPDEQTYQAVNFWLAQRFEQNVQNSGNTDNQQLDNPIESE